MSNWKAVWTGKYPTYCSGEWTLFKDNKIVNVEIPFKKEPAGCYNSYKKFRFHHDWQEEWYTFEDGLKCSDWCNKNQEFLLKITTNKKEWKDIYKAFQENDWRHGSCGGCI